VSPWLENSKELTQDLTAVGRMNQGLDGIDPIEGSVRERDAMIIAPIKSGTRLQPLLGRTEQRFFNVEVEYVDTFNNQTMPGRECPRHFPHSTSSVENKRISREI